MSGNDISARLSEAEDYADRAANNPDQVLLELPRIRSLLREDVSGDIELPTLRIRRYAMATVSELAQYSPQRSGVVIEAVMTTLQETRSHYRYLSENGSPVEQQAKLDICGDILEAGLIVISECGNDSIEILIDSLQFVTGLLALDELPQDVEFQALRTVAKILGERFGHEDGAATYDDETATTIKDGIDGQTLVSEVTARLDRPHPGVRSQAASVVNILVGLYPEALTDAGVVSELIELLDEPDEQTVNVAGAALAGFQRHVEEIDLGAQLVESETVTAVVEMLAFDHPAVRGNGSLLISDIASADPAPLRRADAVPKLVDQLSYDELLSVPANAAGAISDFAEADPAAAEAFADNGAVPLLSELLEHDHPGLRMSVLDALLSLVINSDAAVTQLVGNSVHEQMAGFLDTAVPPVRYRAAMTLHISIQQNEDAVAAIESSDQVETVLRLATHDEIPYREPGLNLLRSGIDHSQRVQQLVVDANGFPRLTALLDEDQPISVTVLLVRILSTLADHVEDIQADAVTPATIQTIGNLLEHEEVAIKKVALGLLHELNDIDLGETILAALTEEHLAALLELLEAEDQVIAGNAASLFGTVAREGMAVDLLVNEGFESLVSLLESAEDPVRANVAWILMHLSDADPEQLHTPAVLTPLIELLTCDLPEGQRNAAGTLLSIAGESQAGARVVADAGAMEPLLQATGSSSPAARAHAIKCLSIIAPFDPSNAQEFQSHRVVTTVLARLDDQEPTVRGTAADAVAELAASSELLAEALVEASAVPRLGRLLRTDQFLLRGSALSALSALAADHPEAPVDAVPDILAVLGDDPTRLTQFDQADYDVYLGENFLLGPEEYPGSLIALELELLETVATTSPTVVAEHISDIIEAVDTDERIVRIALSSLLASLAATAPTAVGGHERTLQELLRSGIPAETAVSLVDGLCHVPSEPTLSPQS